jgi:PIN domain nuclease of toxin-antitoxin system
LRLLLDTHCWIWSVDEPARLNATSRAILLDPETVGFVSAATVWELAIKIRLGKLTLLGGLLDALAESFRRLGFEPLPIHQVHAALTAELPLHHRDPFDRLLIAQAQAEGLSLVTADPLICRYDVDVVWAGRGSRPSAGGEGSVAEPRSGLAPRAAKRIAVSSRRDRARPPAAGRNR